MTRAKSAAFWIAPPLVCLALYWYGLTAWFQADDFAWLRNAHLVNGWDDFWRAMFVPKAQGTIRPWSERGFFLLFYWLFGLDALPFRIWAFLTQFANLTLVAAIMRRLTGSRAIGFWSAVFWTLNIGSARVMSWSAAYNQALCAFFLLAAFYFLLRYIETGRRRDWILQWVIFLLGFGAQELNVVYPALAVGYTFLFARKHFRRTLPLLIPSVIYAVVDRMVAPPATGVYAMHFDAAMLKTLATYWTWSLGPAWPDTMDLLPRWAVNGSTIILTLALLGFVAWSAWQKRWLPLYLLAWYGVLIGPLLPLRDHITGYYIFLPAIGLATLAATALVLAWRNTAAWKTGAALLASIYVVSSVAGAWISVRWIHNHSKRVEHLVLSVARAAQLHPGKVILLKGVDDGLFWVGVLDQPFSLVGANHVYLTPDSGVTAHPGYGDPGEFTLPPGPMLRALETDQAVVYDVAQPRLKNITGYYAATAALKFKDATPRRIDAANPLMAYTLGPTWYQIDGNHRWMPKRATVRIGGPRSPGEKLYLSGVCAAVAPPVEMSVAVDGKPLPPRRIAPGEWFDVEYPLPVEAVGKDTLEISIETNKALYVPGETRELGLTFGVIEIR
ncbi:MAG: glycosyltransferase family 39 protein [Acidobacteria bacterium]|nr:glycosyltransferase family 39 protein [Acidobacteriota bacterium]